MHAKFASSFALCAFLILILLSSQAFAQGPSPTPRDSPPPVGNTVVVTFDTNLPSTNTPISAGNVQDSPVGAYGLILTVDNTQVGFVDNSGNFEGPVTLSWDIGSVHTYQWQSAQTSSKKFTWQSTSGLDSDQSGTITVTSSGSIIASYVVESGSYQSGPSPAAPPPPDCGGTYFTSATSFPSGKCHHNQDLKRYFVFDYDGNQYYAVVESVWDDNGYGYYELALVGDEVVLSVSQNANYDLYVYDVNHTLVGQSKESYGLTDTVRIYSAPPPTPPTTETVSSKFDGQYQVTFSYSVDYGNGPQSAQSVLYFNVKNGIVSHPQNIFSGTVYSDGTVDATYSECSEFTNYNNPGSVTGSLSESGYGDGTFSCGNSFYGNWKAVRLGNQYQPQSSTTPTPTPTPQQSVPKQSLSEQPVNYESYYNSNFGFSIDYPDNWSYKESFTQNGNRVVSFTPNDNSGDIAFEIVFIKNDINYQGLGGQDYLNKMIPDLSSVCSGSTFENVGYLCTDSKLLDSKVDKYHDGPAYSVAYSWTEKAKNGNLYNMVTAAQWIPDGDNRWVLAVVGTMDKFSQYKDEISHMGDSFELDNYEPPSTESMPANNVGLQPVISASSQDIESINSAKDSQTIAAEVSVGNQNIQTKPIDNNVAVHTTNSSSDFLNFSVSAPDQTGPKIIVFDLGNATINVANLKYLGVMYDGQKIDPAESIDAMIHAKSSDRPMFAIVVTHSGAQIMVLIPHFSTHSITITNMSKVIPAVPEFPFSVLALLVAIIPIVLISRFKPAKIF